MTPPGIIVGMNVGDARGGLEVFTPGYTATSVSTKPFALRQYGNGSNNGFPTSWHDGQAISVVTTGSPPVLKSGFPNVCFVLSWKPTLSVLFAGTLDATITSFAQNCQAYFNSVRYKSDGTVNAVNPWPLFISMWHEGEAHMAYADFLCLHAYMYPRFKSACTTYNANNGHSGDPTVPYGAIMEGYVAGGSYYDFAPCPSNTGITSTSATGSVFVPALKSMLDFYTFDVYIMGNNITGVTIDLTYIKQRIPWAAWISKLQLAAGGVDDYPNAGITETNVSVGNGGTIGTNGVNTPLSTNTDRLNWINNVWTHTKDVYNGSGEGFAGYQGTYPGLFMPWYNGMYTSTWDNVMAWDNTAQPTWGTGWSNVQAAQLGYVKESWPATSGKNTAVPIVPTPVTTSVKIVPTKVVTKNYSVPISTTSFTNAAVVVAKSGTTNHPLPVPVNVATTVSIVVRTIGANHLVPIATSSSTTATVGITAHQANIGTYNEVVVYNDSNTIYDQGAPAASGQYDHMVAYDDIYTQYDLGTVPPKNFQINPQTSVSTTAAVTPAINRATRNTALLIRPNVTTSVDVQAIPSFQLGIFDSAITPYDSSTTQYDTAGQVNTQTPIATSVATSAVVAIVPHTGTAQHYLIGLSTQAFTSVGLQVQSPHGSRYTIVISVPAVLTNVFITREVPHVLPHFVHLLRSEVPWQLFIRDDADGRFVGEISDYSSLNATDLFNDVGFYQLVTRSDLPAIQTMLNDIQHPSLVIQRGGKTFLSGPITMMQRDFGGSSGIGNLATGAGAVNAGASGGTPPTFSPTGGEVLTLSGVSDLTWVARRLVIPPNSHDANTYEALVTIGPEALSTVLFHCFGNVKRGAPYTVTPVVAFGPTVTFNARFTAMLQQMQLIAARNVQPGASTSWSMGFGIKDQKTFIYNPVHRGAEFSPIKGTLGAYSIIRQAALYNDLYVAGASTQAPAPSLSTQVRSTTGGSLSASTHDYQVTYVDKYGNETSPSNISSIATTGSFSQVSLFWGAPPVVPGGMRVNVYGRNSADMDFIANVDSLFGQDPNGWTDTGPTDFPVHEGQHPPTGNSTGGIPTRLTAEVLDQTQINQWGSIESFIAQGQFTTVDDLTTYGQAQLAQLWQNTTPFGGNTPLEPIMGQFVPIDTLGQQCCVDYGVGDIASIILNDGTTYTQIIREIDVVLAPSAAPQVSATLGVVFPSLRMFDHVQALRQQVDYLNANSIWS